MLKSVAGFSKRYSVKDMSEYIIEVSECWASLYVLRTNVLYLLSRVHMQTRSRVIILCQSRHVSACLPVCGHKNEHFESVL